MEVIIICFLIFVLGQVLVAHINRNKPTVKCDCHHEFETDEDLEVEEDDDFEYDDEIIPFMDNQIEISLKTPPAPHNIQVSDLERFNGVKRIVQVFPESMDPEFQKIYIVYVDPDHYESIFDTLENLAELDDSHDLSGVESVNRIPKRSL